MNRNQIYDILVKANMYGPVMVWRDRPKHQKNRPYHAQFRPNYDYDQKECTVVTDWGYVRGVHYIYLCRNEIVLESKFEDCKVNINYKDITKFEVNMITEDLLER